MNRRQVLVSGLWLAALAGCARFEAGPALSTPSGVPDAGVSGAPVGSPAATATSSASGVPVSSTGTPAAGATQTGTATEGAGSASETGTATETGGATETATAPGGVGGGFLPTGHVNVLIAGSDSRTANLNEDGRSDVICVAQLSADRTRINLVSIARDTLATMPNGRQTKINAAYAMGGVQALATVVSNSLGGLPIHYTLETGFIWFTELTALLGGFTVENRFASDSSGVAFPAGTLALRQDVALTYARERKGLPNGDFDRTERHRACLTGIVDRLGELARSDAASFGGLTRQLWGKVRASGPRVDEVVTMIPMVAAMSRASVASAMLPIARFGTAGSASVNIVDSGRARELIGQLHAGDIRPYQAKYGLSTKTTGGR